MHDAAAACLSLFGFALLHAAVPARFPFRIRAKERREWGACLRGAAVAALGVSLVLWIRSEGVAAGSLLFGFSALLSGSAFVLMAPFAPRVAWTVALAMPLLTILALAGGSDATP